MKPHQEKEENVHLSSKTDDWATPQDFFDRLNLEFGSFDLDVCASKENAKVPNFYTKEDNGLTQEWCKKNWMNPPYGREIGKWVKKAHEESLKGNYTVALLPARTDTKWWHEYIQDKAEVRFIKGRLKFGGGKNSAPFPSVVVIF